MLQMVDSKHLNAICLDCERSHLLENPRGKSSRTRVMRACFPPLVPHSCSATFSLRIFEQKRDCSLQSTICPEETVVTGRKTNDFSLLLTSFSGVPKFVSMELTTEEPRFNEPLYNEVLSITNDNDSPARPKLQ